MRCNDRKENKMNLKKVKYLLWSLGLAAIPVIAAAAIAAYWFHSQALVIVALVVLLCLCVAEVAVSLTLWRCPHCGGHLGTMVPKCCPHCGKRIDT